MVRDKVGERRKEVEERRSCRWFMLCWDRDSQEGGLDTCWLMFLKDGSQQEVSISTEGPLWCVACFYSWSLTCCLSQWGCRQMSLSSVTTKILFPWWQTSSGPDSIWTAGGGCFSVQPTSSSLLGFEGELAPGKLIYFIPGPWVPLLFLEGCGSHWKNSLVGGSESLRVDL